MIKNFGFAFLLVTSVGGWSATTSWAQQTSKVDSSDEARREEQIAIDKVLSSERWLKATQQFDQWLALQSVYDEREIEALKSELRNQVASMSPAQLESFLQEMEARLAVLLSPEATEARRWVAPLTDQAVQRLRAKYHVEDPVRSSALDLETALRKFAADRRAQVVGAEAFNRARQSSVNAARSANQARQQVSNQASRSQAATFQTHGSSYAPRPRSREPRTFTKHYPGPSYSIGPWGGVWVTPRQ